MSLRPPIDIGTLKDLRWFSRWCREQTVLSTASAESVLIGRGEGSGAGNVEEITLGSGLSMSGTVLSASLFGDVKIKSAVTDRASTTTLADDPHLAGWSLDAATYYEISGLLMYVQDGGDIKFQWDFSQAAQLCACAYWSMSAFDTTVHGNSGTANDLNAVALTLQTDGAGIVQTLMVKGTVKSNATTGGTLDLQWAQNTGSANNTSMQAHSWIRLVPLT